LSNSAVEGIQEVISISLRDGINHSNKVALGSDYRKWAGRNANLKGKKATRAFGSGTEDLIINEDF
jgi:hypothetical protein